MVKYVQHLFDVLQHLRIAAHLDIGPDVGQPTSGKFPRLFLEMVH